MKRGNSHSIRGGGSAAVAGLLLAASLALTVGASDARAVVVGAAPVLPIPAGAPAGPPPIPALPAAGTSAPPADQIADPIKPAAACGGWQLQSNYGDRWPAASTWWEYRCSLEVAQYYNFCPGPACPAFCPDCYWDTQDWTDYFYWDGSNAVFYGQAYSDSQVFDSGDSTFSNAWWDAATAQWYDLGPFTLTVSTASTAGSGWGQVSSDPAGVDCPRSWCQASFDNGTTVALTATPDASSVFTGWSGDCSGTGSCHVTMAQAHSVTATFALKTRLTVSRPGFGSGQVSSNPAGISCGASCQAAFNPGTVVSLTAIPDAGSTFIGWSGDCSGTGTCQVTMNQNHSVNAVFALVTLPHASFTVACTGLACSFDGSASTDSNGTLVSYAWSFGDGAVGSGKTISHTYPAKGSYTVALTVTDNTGATDTASRVVSPITLTARGYTANGLEKAALSWNGPSGTIFDVYRNSAQLVTVPNTAYTDTIGTTPGSYRYKVCAAATAICSNQVTVSFSSQQE